MKNKLDVESELNKSRNGWILAILINRHQQWFRNGTIYESATETFLYRSFKWLGTMHGKPVYSFVCRLDQPDKTFFKAWVSFAIKDRGRIRFKIEPQYRHDYPTSKFDTYDEAVAAIELWKEGNIQ